MPNYDYMCSECEHKFEDIYTIDSRHEPETKPCPNCEKLSVKLTIGAPALVSPFRIDGLVKPKGDFRERIQQIKQLSGKKTTIRDY